MHTDAVFYQLVTSLITSPAMVVDDTSKLGKRVLNIKEILKGSRNNTRYVTYKALSPILSNFSI